MSSQSQGSGMAMQKSGGHYRRLGVMIIVSVVAMFALMYSMVDRLENVYANVNQFYMAGLMTAAMLVIELVLMGGMYPNKKVNTSLIAAGVVALALFWLFTRRQTLVGDRQFLRSMIPHHAAAILMCEQASIEAPEIRQLCQGIVSRQQTEITQMKAILGSRK